MTRIKEYWPYPADAYDGITNYIKERIETIRKEQERFSQISTSYIIKDNKIAELQAVLSKIEEEEKEKKWRMRDLTK